MYVHCALDRLASVGVMVWIGLNHLKEGWGWQWSDGAPLSLVNFTTGSDRQHTALHHLRDTAAMSVPADNCSLVYSSVGQLSVCEGWLRLNQCCLQLYLFNFCIQHHLQMLRILEIVNWEMGCIVWQLFFFVFFFTSNAAVENRKWSKKTIYKTKAPPHHYVPIRFACQPIRGRQAVRGLQLCPWRSLAESFLWVGAALHLQENA